MTHKVRIRRSLALPIALTMVAMAASALAEPLRFGRFFTDHMVLQRDQPVVIRGMADPGTAVTVGFAGQKKTGKTSDDGVWEVTLDPMPAGHESRRLTASSPGAQPVTLTDVLVGDVILFARQTTVDISLGRDADGRNAAASHGPNPLFRAVRIATVPATTPQADLDPTATDGWAMVDTGVSPKMSAAAFYLGRDVAAKADVPIGIVDLNMGSAFPIGWLSREALEETEKFYSGRDVPGQLERFDNLVDLHQKGEPMPPKEIITSNVTEHAMFPAGGYNAVLNPLKGLALKAAIVQLGNDYPYMVYGELERTGKHLDRKELNRAYVITYDIRKTGWRMEPVTTPRIPREWRSVFGRDDLPIGLVLPPASDLHTLGLHHREMRELHRQTSLANPGVSVILPGSENRIFSAQPEDEALLADRCAHWLLGDVYRKADIPATGPLFASADMNLNTATIHFEKGTAAGLRAVGDALDYFEAAGVEGDYSPAKATIQGETVHITSDTVNRIVRVRYNWNKHPNQGLVNAAGLPAIPFRSETAPYQWFVTNSDNDLPEEYYTPANEWKKSDVTLVNGQLKTFGYGNFAGWLGPLGVKTGPFGPNMGVREVKPGSPAEGKLMVGDVIYSANGEMLGDKAWEVMAAAITDSETAARAGKLVLGVRRSGENREVEVTLEVMGAYSSTAPYDCPKTEKIVSDLEQWCVANGAKAGFLNNDAIFMLATGNPELQGYVRRIVYSIIEGKDPNRPIEPTNAGKSWHNSAEAFLLGEYYLATGDRNVLPHLKHACDRLAATQNPLGGWRHNFPGGPTYGLIPNAGLPGVMGMHFAKEAGLDINLESYKLGVNHFADQRAETGFLIYGFGGCQRPVPPSFDPEVLENGRLTSYNGGLSAAGILMEFAGKPRAAHLCSFISAYAWNNTFGGHGGNFWNNFWTPLGAHQHGRAAFIHFWKKHRWYRESNRMFDGSLIQHESGKVGAACGVALVAPRQRIQIVGAPKSPFAASAPQYLNPALTAYWEKDYDKCETLVNELLAGGTVGKADRPTVEYLARAAREIRESIDADLTRMGKALEQGRPADAKADLTQLAAVMPTGDTRLATMKEVIAATKSAPQPKPPSKQVADKEEEKREWECLVTEIATGLSKKGTDTFGIGKVPEEEASVWRLKVVESLSQAPEEWTSPTFDDSSWDKTHLPISWRMYHTALLRTKFTVKDKTAFDGLRFRGWFFRQQAMEIYLNGTLIGKVNNLEKKTSNVMNEFNDSALKLLTNGENTLAVTTRHNWRWGMLFMKVYNDGYGFRLDARKKQE